MASMMGSHRPSPLQSRVSRPGGHRRTASNSSEASHGSSSSASEDQFAFSAGNTPATENPPSLQARSITSTPRDGLLFGKAEANSRWQLSKDTPRSLVDSPQLTTSQPIAIVPPTVRKLNTAPAPTPPEPLSARGDLPGGYFPFHEDPASRVRHTHPFQLDASQARHHSLHQASESEPAMSASVASSRLATSMSTSPHSTTCGPPSTARSDSRTPISSYLPIGVHDTAALPMGKYYPSNYESRPGSSSHQKQQRPLSKSYAAASIKSEPQVPKFRREQSHTRTGSDVKRRLLQYQRDMIAQATIAASALLEKNGSTADPNSVLSRSSLGGLSLKNIELGGTMLRTHKPPSPRLAPLGSPGPVTPMDLENASSDSYLTLGRPMTGPDATQHAAEVTRAMQVEQTRQYQRAQHSPASELHAVSF